MIYKKNSGKVFRSIAFCLGAALALSSCGVVGIDPKPEPVVDKKADLPHRVAVLPFANNTPDPNAGAVVRKMFYNFFSSLNYLDAEPGRVDEMLRKKGLYDKLLSGEPIDAGSLGQFLGVDAVIFGEVTEFGKTYAVIYAETEAGLKAKMVSCGNGKTFWELEHTAALSRGDIPISLTGLAMTVVKSVIDFNQAKKVNAASKLSMQMVDTIPNPERVTEPPPRIDVLVHNGAERLIRPDQSLRIALIGDPGNKASWEVSPLTGRMPLTEKEPGTYIGAYLVRPDDRLMYGRVTGYLESANGLESRWTDVLGSVFMAEPTVLPSIISKNQVLTAGKSPYFIEEALLVRPGATLTIEPGVILWFNKLGLIVQGRIVARGSEDSPIRISGLGDRKWKGILMDRSDERNLFSYCEISKAENGLRTSGSFIFLDRCLFTENEWGMVLDGGRAEIKQCLVSGCLKAGVSARNAEIVVTDSVIAQNQSGGILLKKAKAMLRNNSVYNNGGYDLKVLEGKEAVTAVGNWWGKASPEQARIIGDVEIIPVSNQPADATIFERVFQFSD